MSTRRMTSPFFIPIDFAFVSSPCLSVSHSGCATPFVPSGDECGMCLSRRCFFLAVAFAIAPCPFRNKKIMFDKPAFLSPWSDWTPVKMTDVVLCCLSLCPSGSLPDCPDGYTLNGNTCGMSLLSCCFFSVVSYRLARSCRCFFPSVLFCFLLVPDSAFAPFFPRIFTDLFRILVPLSFFLVSFALSFSLPFSCCFAFKSRCSSLLPFCMCDCLFLSAVSGQDCDTYPGSAQVGYSTNRTGCTKTKKSGSTCTFACDPGIGTGDGLTATCTIFGNWTTTGTPCGESNACNGKKEPFWFLLLFPSCSTLFLLFFFLSRSIAPFSFVSQEAACSR